MCKRYSIKDINCRKTKQFDRIKYDFNLNSHCTKNKGMPFPIVGSDV